MQTSLSTAPTENVDARQEEIKAGKERAYVLQRLGHACMGTAHGLQRRKADERQLNQHRLMYLLYDAPQ